MNQPTIPHRAVSHIERELAQLRHKMQSEVLPSIPLLEAEVQKWTSKTVLDPIHRPDLYEATKAVEAAQQVWVNRAKDNTTVSNLTRELTEATEAKRIEAANRADSRLNAAIGEYTHACLVAARAMRTLLNTQHQSAQVPGASSNLSHLRLHQFHVPHLHPISFGGALGESMLQGAVGFEQQNDFSIRPDLEKAA